MSTNVRCEFCETKMQDEKCVFAVYKRVINGKEHYFCCTRHADQFEQNLTKSDSNKKISR